MWGLYVHWSLLFYLLLLVEDQLSHEKECYITLAFGASGRSTFTWEGVLHYFSCKWKIKFHMRECCYCKWKVKFHIRECCYITLAASGRSTFTWEGSVTIFLVFGASGRSTCSWDGVFLAANGRSTFTWEGNVTIFLVQVEDQLSHERKVLHYFSICCKWKISFQIGGI